MLRNTFRRFIGLIIVAVMGIAVVRYLYQSWGNQYVWSALGWGGSLILILALIVWGAYQADLRMKKRQE